MITGVAEARVRVHVASEEIAAGLVLAFERVVTEASLHVVVLRPADHGQCAELRIALRLIRREQWRPSGSPQRLHSQGTSSPAVHDRSATGRVCQVRLMSMPVMAVPATGDTSGAARDLKAHSC